MIKKNQNGIINKFINGTKISMIKKIRNGIINKFINGTNYV